MKILIFCKINLKKILRYYIFIVWYLLVLKVVENLNVYNVSKLRVKNNDIDSNNNELGI